MNTKLIVALDVDSAEQGLDLVARIGPDVEWYKIGKQLFTREGPGMVSRLKAAGKKVFLDLKFHDIPNTVAQAVRSAGAIGADMTNVHALGGPAMLEAAAAAGRDAGVITLAVTVLTSMDAVQLAAVGLPADPPSMVERLARLSEGCGLHGVVCSALEIGLVRDACGPEFLTVVPGIRPTGKDHGDQKRVMTPGEAARAGAGYIVVGRPITQADDPQAAARAVLDEL